MIINPINPLALQKAASDIVAKKVMLLFMLCVMLFFTQPAQAATVSSLGDMLQHFQNEMGAIWTMLVWLTRLMGIMFIAQGVFRLKKFGQMTVFMMSHVNLTEGVVYLFIGSMFIFSKYMIDSFLLSLWGYDTGSIVGYGQAVNEADKILQPIMMTVQVVGFVAFIRGFIIFSRMGTQSAQPGTFGKAMTFILGGIAAINIQGTMETLRATFGLS